MKHRLILTALVGLLQGPLAAAEDLLPASAFAFPSLQESGGARPIGLGSTYVGVAEGSAAMLWNPAGLARLRSAELGLHHQVGFLGATQEILTLGSPWGRQSGVGASIIYEDNGVFEGRDINGTVTDSYSARAYGLSLGMATARRHGLAWGAALKFQHQDLAEVGQTAVAADLGVHWSQGPAFSLGAAYTNLGPDVDGRPLAQGLQVGLASYLGAQSKFQWLLALSGEVLTRGNSSIRIGLEHCIHQVLALRAGYGAELNGPAAVGLDGWSFGGGVIIKGLSIDYAYVPLEALGGRQRLSLTHAFGQVRPADPQPSGRIDREPVLVFTDDDFEPDSYSSQERLSAAAEARLYQALTQVSAYKGAQLTVQGNTSLMLEPHADGNGPALREIGARRATLVREYLRLKMPLARVSSTVTNGSGKGTPASVFEVILR